MILRGSIHQEDIIIINIYALKCRTPKYVKQTFTELNDKEALSFHF